MNSRLSPTEQDLYDALARRPGQFVPHDVLRREVWGRREITYATVPTYIRYLRRKIGAGRIVNDPGKGYMLMDNSGPYGVDGAGI